MFFEKALEAIALDRKNQIENNPFFDILYSGNLTRWQYIAYLKETYHLVRHTPQMLTLAAEKVGHSDPWLRDFFKEFAHEEKGHDLLCVNDIRGLGEEPEKILSEKPLGGSWAMTTQNYYHGTLGNPISIIGYAIATEGLGSEFAKSVAELLETKYGFGRDATSFLRLHGYEDIEHVELARTAWERYSPNPSHYSDMLHTWRMTLQYYGQLFKDALALGNLWESQNRFQSEHNVQDERALT